MNKIPTGMLYIFIKKKWKYYLSRWLTSVKVMRGKQRQISYHTGALFIQWQREVINLNNTRQMRRRIFFCFLRDVISKLRYERLRTQIRKGFVIVSPAHAFKSAWCFQDNVFVLVINSGREFSWICNSITVAMQGM